MLFCAYLIGVTLDLSLSRSIWRARTRCSVAQKIPTSPYFFFLKKVCGYNCVWCRHNLRLSSAGGSPLQSPPPAGNTLGTLQCDAYPIVFGADTFRKLSNLPLNLRTFPDALNTQHKISLLLLLVVFFLS